MNEAFDPHEIAEIKRISQIPFSPSATAKDEVSVQHVDLMCDQESRPISEFKRMCNFHVKHLLTMR